MTSTPRKILPTYIQATGNSNIRQYQARAAAQVYSTARNVLPSSIANYWLPEPPAPASLSASAIQDPTDSSPRGRFAAFDVLRGRDVLVKAVGCSFSIYNVCDSGAELEELCGYTLSHEIISLKLVPCPDVDTPPAAAVLTRTGDFELSVVSLSASLTTNHSVVLPKNVNTISLTTSPHYIALTTPKTLIVYSPTLTLLSTIPVPFAAVTGSARWLIYPVSRINPATPRSPILDTPPEIRLVERVARGLTKEVVSWGRETGEKIGEAISSYLNPPSSPPTPEKGPPAAPATGNRHYTTLVLHDIPTNRILTQFSIPYKLGFMSLSPSGTVLFCSPPKGDEFYVYSLYQVPTSLHLLATFSRGYTYARVTDVVWRVDNGCIGVISARGTGHIFSLKRRGKEPARAVGKIKIDRGVKTFMFVRRIREHRRSSATKDEAPDVLTLADPTEKVGSWKLAPATNSTIGLLTAYFNPPTASDEQQSIPLAQQIADYILPRVHRDLAFPSLTSSPIIKAAFTNQKDSNIDCTARAEVECSLSTKGVQGVRGIRLFGYALSSPYDDFGPPSPAWTVQEIDLGMPRGQVRFFGISETSSGSRSLETPPSSEHDSTDLTPDNKKKRRKAKDGIEKAILASLGAELDKSRMITVPPTPPGSFSTPKIQPSEWVGDILDRGKTIVRNVRRRSSVRGTREDIDFEEGVEVLSLNDASPLTLERSESGESEGSGNVKVSGEASVVGEWDS